MTVALNGRPNKPKRVLLSMCPSCHTWTSYMIVESVDERTRVYRCKCGNEKLLAPPSGRGQR